MLHLLSVRLSDNPDAPLCSNATGLYNRLSKQPGGWGPAHDRALVQGIFRAG